MKTAMQELLGLVEQMFNNAKTIEIESSMNDVINIITQEGLPKEKEQIIDANIAGMEFIPVDPNRYQEDAEQYYDITFNTEEPELVQINQGNPVTKGSTALVRTFNTEEK